MLYKRHEITYKLEWIAIGKNSLTRDINIYKKDDNRIRIFVIDRTKTSKYLVYNRAIY